LKPHSALRCADTPLPCDPCKPPLPLRCGRCGRWALGRSSHEHSERRSSPTAMRTGGNIAAVLRRWLQCAVAGRARNATVYGTKHTMSCGIPALGRHQLRAVWGT
jgi:hypothetical protein